MKRTSELYGESSDEDDEEDNYKEMLETMFNKLSKINNEEEFEKYILDYLNDYNPNDEAIDIDIRFYWFFQTILTEQPERQIDLKSETLEELKENEEWKDFEDISSSDDDLQPKLRF